MLKRHIITIVTAGTTGTGDMPMVNGYLHSIRYLKSGGASPYANGVDLAVTIVGSGQGVLAVTDMNASAQWQPRLPIHAAADAAAISGGADRVMLVKDVLRFALSSAGDAKTGQFEITVDERPSR